MSGENWTWRNFCVHLLTEYSSATWKAHSLLWSFDSLDSSLLWGMCVLCSFLNYFFYKFWGVYFLNDFFIHLLCLSSSVAMLCLLVHVTYPAPQPPPPVHAWWPQTSPLGLQTIFHHLYERFFTCIGFPELHPSIPHHHWWGRVDGQLTLQTALKSLEWRTLDFFTQLC